MVEGLGLKFCRLRFGAQCVRGGVGWGGVGWGAPQSLRANKRSPTFHKDSQSLCVCDEFFWVQACRVEGIGFRVTGSLGLRQNQMQPHEPISHQRLQIEWLKLVTEGSIL